MAKDFSIIADILNDYAIDLQEQIKLSADKISKEGVNKLRNANTYHVRTGKYNKGWKVKKSDTYNDVKRTIYNSAKDIGNLTSWLENGHATINGGRTKAFPHIAPVETYCVEEFEREVKKLIQKG